MSKIAVLASTIVSVEEWRRISGVAPAMAPWILTEQNARDVGPFMSLICLAAWETRGSRDQRPLRAFIEAECMVRRTPNAPVEDEAPDDDGNHVAELDESTPVASREELDDISRLLDLGVNPAVVTRASASLRRVLVNIQRGDSILFRSHVEAYARSWRLPAWRPPEETSASNFVFPVAPEISQQERDLRATGMNPALIGMLGDETRNRLHTQSSQDVARFTETVVEIARRHGIAPWQLPATEEQRLEARRNTALATIRSFMGDADISVLERAPLTTVYVCESHARRGLGLAQTGDHAAAEDRRTTIRRTIQAAIDAEAGFLPEPVPAPEPMRAPTPQVRRVDPLQDNLRSYMRAAQAEDAERREQRDRNARLRREVETRMRRASGQDPDEDL